MTIFESHSNPNVQHDLDLWMRVREYDKANAELPFTPVLSKKQKQQVRKQLQIGKPPPYKTRSQRGSKSGDQRTRQGLVIGVASDSSDFLGPERVPSS